MHVEVQHPCVRHKLALLRDMTTSPKQFRELATEITTLVCYEALQGVALREVEVQTPMSKTTAHKIAEDIVVVPILRAGVGMLEGILGLVPTASVGFVGLYRDENSKQPIEYYCKLPPASESLHYIVVDPMLATGGSTIATLDLIRARGPARIAVICIITCPEGLAAVAAAHPDVTVFAASVDERLDERKYILPGLGDAGDRLFGTA